MKELKEFEQNAVKRILKGARFNGKFYTEKNGKTFIYAGNIKFQIINKEAFLAAVQRTEVSGKFDTGYGYYGTAADAARGYDGIENL